MCCKIKSDTPVNCTVRYKGQNNIMNSLLMYAIYDQIYFAWTFLGASTIERVLDVFKGSYHTANHPCINKIMYSGI